MRIFSRFIIIVFGLGFLATSCSKGGSAPASATALDGSSIPAGAEDSMTGCDHDTDSAAIVKHAWPYPSDARNIQWTGKPYDRVRLKLTPNPATFYTATVSWKNGQPIEVLDSWVYLEKPRNVVANEDIWVTRKVWDQGLKVDKQFKVASRGEQVGFLFYNSNDVCMVETEEGPAWTRCTLGQTFEGVTADDPFACEQVWWVKVKKSKTDQGWMPFDDALMVRLPAPDDATK
ncbi:MAG: hypothetical protein AAGF92_23745 [Myxococcota bacterium]